MSWTIGKSQVYSTVRTGNTVRYVSVRSPSKEISYKKYLGLAAVIFAVVLVTSNFGAAFSKNNTDELVNLILTGSDIFTSPDSSGRDVSSNGTDSNSTYTPY